MRRSAFFSARISAVLGRRRQKVSWLPLACYALLCLPTTESVIFYILLLLPLLDRHEAIVVNKEKEGSNFWTRVEWMTKERWVRSGLGRLIKDAVPEVKRRKFDDSVITIKRNINFFT